METGIVAGKITRCLIRKQPKEKINTALNQFILPAFPLI